ncbi:protein IQ-DOMAIN 19-like isoform X2 [Diospyros lotus]|uniref:protein IQ-DOMAIN 19-like isoform X2 n=1 Tax=Diospyros lotus TaxID=55363 RepID=UPI0022530B3F|nr:protein IQ-DOMAIN 19-like isoform X2 [Diospyros lotus]
MGKASKWIIRHLLMGRSKEEKDEKQETTSSFPAATLAPAPPQTTSKQKRRWSFARSSSADSGGRRSSRGFDSYLVDQIVANALPEFGKEQEREAAVEYYHHIPVAAAQEAIKTVIACKPARARGPTENAAATKIQAAFRCYLARRALLALRGLVKLQAVVRGYLVRKTTTATLRGMHALLSIQVRARVQRIQMADHHYHHLDAQLDCKRRITTHHDRSGLVHQHHKKEYATERGDANSSKTQADFKSRSRFIDRPPHPQIEIGRREHDLGHFAGRLSISKRAHRLLTFPDHPSSASSGTSSRASNSQFGEHVDAQNLWLPNFMANTESSNAKSRSKSEPKQRPKHTSSPKLRCRRSTSSEQMEIASDFEYRVKKQQQQQASSSNGHKNRYPWLVKLYRSSRRKAVQNYNNEHEYDSNSIATPKNKTLIGYYELQPPVNLF